MAITLLAATTSATQSSEFRIRGGSDKVTIIAEPLLAGTEECNLQQSVDGGTTWRNVVDGILKAALGSRAYELSAPGHYRIDKEATATATGVYLEGKCKLL